MAGRPVPRSASFAFDIATRSLDEQLHRVEALDTKAVGLLAADGLLVGLVLGPHGLLAAAPPWLAIAAGIGLIVSLGCALAAFANRGYLLAPEARTIALLASAPEDWIRWRVIGNVLDAIDANRRQLRQKARVLSVAQLILLVALGLVGGYFLWTRATGGA